MTAYEVPPEAEWVRTNRRANGANYEDPDAPRVQGPWHALRPGLDLTWCGRRPQRLLSSTTQTLPTTTLPEGPRCLTCETGLFTGMGQTYRRNR